MTNYWSRHPTPRPVMHLVASASGGKANYVRELSTAQIATFFQRQVLSFSPSNTRLPQGVGRLRYQPLDFAWGANQWKFALQAGAVALGQGTIAHAHHAMVAPADVFSVHGYYCRDWMARYATGDKKRSLAQRLHFQMMSAVERHSISNARRVVFVSQENRHFAENSLGIERPESFLVIHPGVDTHVFHPRLRISSKEHRQRFFPKIPPENRWLLFAGHAFGPKGLLRIVDALNRSTHPSEWHLLVFGKDPEGQANLEAKLPTIQKRVTLFQSDKYLSSALSLADAFLMDSCTEGFPLVILEAMSSGCPPFVTPFLPWSQELTTGAQGIFVASSAEEIVHASLSLSTAELLTLGDLARQAAVKQSWESVAQRYEEVYRSLDEREFARENGF